MDRISSTNGCQYMEMKAKTEIVLYVWYTLLLVSLSVDNVMAMKVGDSNNFDIPDVTTYSDHLFSLSFRRYPGLGSEYVNIMIGELNPYNNADSRVAEKERIISPLPSWLSYNDSMQTLEGIPTSRDRKQTLLFVSAKCHPVSECKEKRAIFQISVIDRSWDKSAKLLSLKEHSDTEDGRNPEMLGSIDDSDSECDQDKVVASLIICASFKHVSTMSKVQLIRNVAHFISFPASAIAMESSSTQNLKAVEYGYQIISAGPGTGEEECALNENVEIIWQLQCQMVKHLVDFVKVLQHNVDVGRFHQETGFTVVGWYIASSNSLLTRKRRRRRNAGKPTLGPTPTLNPPHPTRMSSFQDIHYSSNIFQSSSELTDSSSITSSSFRLSDMAKSSLSYMESILPTTSSFISSNTLIKTSSPFILSESQGVLSSQQILPSNVENIESSISIQVMSGLFPTGIKSLPPGSRSSENYLTSTSSELPPSVLMEPLSTPLMPHSQKDYLSQGAEIQFSSVLAKSLHVPESFTTNSKWISTLKSVESSEESILDLKPSQSIFNDKSFGPITLEPSTPKLSLPHTTSHILDVQSKSELDVGDISSSFMPVEIRPSEDNIITPTSVFVNDFDKVTENPDPISFNEYIASVQDSIISPFDVQSSHRFLTNHFEASFLSSNVSDSIVNVGIDSSLMNESPPESFMSVYTFQGSEIDENIISPLPSLSSMERGSLDKLNVSEMQPSLVLTPVYSIQVTEVFFNKMSLLLSATPVTEDGDTVSTMTIIPTPDQHLTEGVSDFERTVRAATKEVTTPPSTTELDSTEGTVYGPTACGWGSVDCVTQGSANSWPLVENPISLIIGEQGRALELKIPRDVFFDLEDGNTDSLHLELELPSGKKLPENFWLYLVNVWPGRKGSPTKMLKGLPLHQDMDINNVSVVLVATDSGGLQARDSIVLQINDSPRTQFTHQFTLTFAIDFQDFIHKRDNIVQLMGRIASHFNDSSPHFITVLEVLKGSFILSWTNNTLSGPMCQRQAINQLYNRMVRKDRTVRSSFNRKIGRHLELLKIQFEYLGSCIIPTTTTTTTTTIFSSSRAGPGLSVWAHIILPILIALVVFIFILFLIFMCNRHRKRQEALNIIEKDAFSNDRNPIIFPNEMESDDPALQPKSPLVLPSDSHHLNDSPQHQHYQQQHRQHRHGRHHEEDSYERSSKQEPSSSSSRGKNAHNQHHHPHQGRNSKDKTHKKSKDSRGSGAGVSDPSSISSDRPSNSNCIEDDNIITPDEVSNTTSSLPSEVGVPNTHSPIKRQLPPYWQAQGHHPPPYRLPPPYSDDAEDKPVFGAVNENPFLKSTCTTTQV